MSRYHSYIATAVQLIQTYAGKEPFAVFIKKYFAANKKHGSSDRRNISALCYGYFRIAHAFKGRPIPEVLKTGEYLLQNKSPLLADLDPGLNETIHLPVQEKLNNLGINVRDVFPGIPFLTPLIDENLFCTSLLWQPDVFLRARPGKMEQVLKSLSKNEINYNREANNAIRLNAAVKLEGMLKINYEAVVQDYSSQHTLDFLDSLNFSTQADAWDCCTASGGKALLLYDKLHGQVRLTLSDIRESILINLKARLGEARVPVMKIFQADLLTEKYDGAFDIIICDAPCTGSGTWARTPEQIFFYKQEWITEYSIKQKQIVKNTISSLKQNGVYCYITCSVFKAENEDVAEYITKLGLKLLHQEYFKGYERKADTLYAAFFSY